MSEYFPEPISFEETVKVELYLPSYATKQILKMQQFLIHQIFLKKLIYLT